MRLIIGSNLPLVDNPRRLDPVDQVGIKLGGSPIHSTQLYEAKPPIECRRRRRDNSKEVEQRWKVFKQL